MGGLASSQPKPGVVSFVQQEIKSAHAVLFVKKSCPYCTRAVDLLRNYVDDKFTDSDMKIIDITNRPDCGAIQDYLLSITGARTVPRIFIGTQSIGGCSDLEQLHKNNTLLGLLENK